MKVLIIGGGGREHAFALKLAASPHQPQLHFAPGNPGMESLGLCHAVPAQDIQGLLDLALRESIDLTLVGPEQPLVDGLVDRFREKGLAVFGPTKAAARLEGSKAFSKDFMARYGIPTAAFATFTEGSRAKAYIESHGAPIVVKTSGLAAGKGAIVCATLSEALEAVDSMLGPQAVFGEAGAEVVVEEFMQGEEVSVFALCDGENYVLLPSAQDHKRIFDEDKGPNTGGMGAYSPAPVLTAALLDEVHSRIIAPTLEGMRKEGCPYTGFLYVGLMITPQGPKVVEYNCRLGDPEAQVVLPLLREDLLDLLLEAVQVNGLKGRKVQPTQGAAAVVVLAAQGYPGKYRTGDTIEGLEKMAGLIRAHAVHAGTRRAVDGGRSHIETGGGRVLGLVGLGDDLQEALERAYGAVEKIRFEGMQFRRDIGQRGLARIKSD